MSVFSELPGLMNSNIQRLLIAPGQNLKRVLAKTGWSRRHVPWGSLAALAREELHPVRSNARPRVPAPSPGGFFNPLNQRAPS